MRSGSMAATPLADPRSARQPDGPAYAISDSQCYDQSAFRWTDAGWRGRVLRGAVIYELHIGTFTPAGTFDAAIERLDFTWSRSASISSSSCPSRRSPAGHGWGYDGISLWAVHEPYGGPDGLKRFVAACHERGLAVLLDVVYNHVGIGNRLAAFGPYFTDQHLTPWGPAVNLDQPGLGRGPRVHRRQRAHVAARLSPGRAAAGRRARPGGSPRRATCWRELAARVRPSCPVRLAPGAGA